MENIPPGRFIPIIEKTDLINDLTRLVIEECVNFVADRDSDMDFVSINFSVNSISMKNIRFLDEKVKERGIEPSLIVIEVAGDY